MNSVELIGRLTRDPDIRHGKSDVAAFTLAVERDGQKDEDGNKITDFPRIKVFGRSVSVVEKNVKKGRQVAIQGRIQTGSYQKNGETVYTTDVVATRVELISDGQRAKPEPSQDSFAEADEDVPF